MSSPTGRPGLTNVSRHTRVPFWQQLLAALGLSVVVSLLLGQLLRGLPWLESLYRRYNVQGTGDNARWLAEVLHHAAWLVYLFPLALMAVAAVAAARRRRLDTTEVLTCALVGGFLARAMLACLFLGSWDLDWFAKMAEAYANGINIYQAKLPHYNHPPLFPILSGTATWLVRPAGGDGILVIKLIIVGADLLLGFLLARGARAATQKHQLWWAAAYLLNPVAIYMAGYHGNVEPLMLLTCTLALLRFNRGGFVGQLQAALLLGVCISIKLWPVIFFPALLVRAPLRHWPALALAFAAPPLLSDLLLFLFAGYWVDFHKIVGYRGVPGLGGLSKVADVGAYLLGADAKTILSFFRHSSLPSLVMGLAVLVSAWRTRHASLAEAWLASCLAFYALGSNLSNQYLLWVLPWAILSRERWFWGYSALATLYLGLQPMFPNRPYQYNPGAVLPIAVWIFSTIWWVRLLSRRSHLSDTPTYNPPPPQDSAKRIGCHGGQGAFNA